MELGKPVILGNGFCRSTFDDRNNESALFVDSSDPVDISKGIIRLIENPGFAREMAGNAHKYILPRFSWDKTADNTLMLYKKIVGGKR
jgi:glycosyltransferase involved in cell wall biosynthesis